MRVYRTLDGRHVAEGHSDAAFLAFSQYDDVPTEVVAELEAKKAAKPANKSRTPQANKGEAKEV